MRKYVPSYSGTLRSHGLTLPHCISECSGIRIFGKRIKSIAFSTDAAIIKNINADAIIAVYPFTPQPTITLSYTFFEVGGKTPPAPESTAAVGLMLPAAAPRQETGS